jgi:hypothetical protein
MWHERLLPLERLRRVAISADGNRARGRVSLLRCVERAFP